MYFYIILNLKERVGFGITGSPRKRLKNYTGMWGELASFNYLFEGEPAHIKRLENIIKKMHSDMIWNVEEWKTEWLNNEHNVDEFYEFVLNDIIKYRNMPIKLIATDVIFDNDMKKGYK